MPRATRMLTSIALTLLACALLAAPALGSANDVIRDCSEDGVLNGHYSHSELAKALDKLPSDLDEYTDCRAVIRSAELRSANKRGSGPGIVGKVDTVSPPSADEQRKVDEASRSGDPVRIGGQTVQPGLNTAGLGADLPPLVLALLIAIGGAMAAGSVLAIRRNPRLARAAAPVTDPLRKLAVRARDGISRFRR